LPEIVRIKVWDRDATVLWSDDRKLIGQRFPDDEELQAGLAGKVSVEIKKLSKSEQADDRGRFSVLAEIYVPIFAKEGGGVIGAVEVYKAPVRLFAAIRRGRIVIWTISLVGGLALYLVLLPLVRQVYGRRVYEEALRTHAEGLERQVAERTRELRDEITERKRVEEQLRQAQKLEAVGRLAGGVAHDFNNLLGVILGHSDLLLSRLGSDSPLHRHVDLILKTAAKAGALTQQLLAFSRKQILAPKVLDLNAVVTGMEKMLRRLIGEDVDLAIVLDPALGHVKADPGQLEQVILNLAVNARDAMPQGGRLTLETASVELDEAYVRRHPGAQRGPHVVLAVSDTGVGMDAEAQARLFEPFFTTKGPGRGTGLGLATVYGIVKQSGGNIWVFSEPGRGTTFKICLPQADAAAAPVEPERARTQALQGSETVLLVEDEADLRDLAREILQMYGYTVLAAGHPAEALRLGQQHEGSIHLLLTDVVMPGMSGRELADRLAPRHGAMQVLYMSGYTDEAIVRHGVLAEGTAFLQKPFTPDTLARQVRQVLAAAPAR
jgi:signal transduction histidine kinase/ActR/RegA family two-component response regulator